MRRTRLKVTHPDMRTRKATMPLLSLHSSSSDYLGGGYILPSYSTMKHEASPLSSKGLLNLNN